MARSTSAMVSRSAGRRMGMPALLTRTSSGPSSSQIRRRPGRRRPRGRPGRRPTSASPARVGPAVGGHLLQPVGPAGHQGHGGAPGGQQPGRGRPDARGGPGDQSRRRAGVRTARPVGPSVGQVPSRSSAEVRPSHPVAGGRGASTARGRWPPGARRAGGPARAGRAGWGSRRWRPAWRPCPADRDDGRRGPQPAAEQLGDPPGQQAGQVRVAGVLVAEPARGADARRRRGRPGPAARRRG